MVVVNRTSNKNNDYDEDWRQRFASKYDENLKCYTCSELTTVSASALYLYKQRRHCWYWSCSRSGGGRKGGGGGTLYPVHCTVWYSGYRGYIGYSTIWWGYTVLYNTVDTIDTLWRVHCTVQYSGYIWREYFLKGKRKPSRYKSEKNSFIVNHHLF